MDPTKDPTPGTAAEAADDPAKRRAADRLIGALQKAVRIVGYFSAQHQAATAALDEIIEVATQVTTDFGELALKLTGDGLYVGEHRVTHYSPTEDPHLFRLFHNGVRQLSFRAGITREDVIGFLEAITADMSQPEFAEEDVITTLWARNIVGIRWVVVETFTEVDNEEEQELQSRAADELSSFLDDTLRDRLGGDLHAGHTSDEAALTLTGGDVRFFQAESIGALLGALPEQEVAPSGEAMYSIGGAEGEAMVAEITRDETVLPSRFLDAVLAATASTSSADDLQSAAACIALTLGTLARQSGHASIGQVFARLLQWLATVSPDDKLAVSVTELVLGGPLVTGAVAAIDSCADEDVPVVLSILGAAPPEAVLRVVRNVTAAKTRDRRRDAFAVLLRRTGGPELFGSLLRELDEDGAVDVLDACAGLSSPMDAQPVAASAAVHVSAAVRARGVQMLARSGVEAMLPRIAEKVFDPDPSVRMAAIRAMASTGKSAEHLRSALQSPELAELSLPEKRLLALLLAHVEGMRAAPLLHMLLGRKAIFGAVQNDEVRAAAAAGLGYIPDPRAQASLERVAKSSFATASLKVEARKVADALAAGKAAYGEADLRQLLAPPPAARPTADTPARKPPSVPPPGGSTLPPPPVRPTAPPASRPTAAPAPAPPRSSQPAPTPVVPAPATPPAPTPRPSAPPAAATLPDPVAAFAAFAEEPPAPSVAASPPPERSSQASSIFAPPPVFAPTVAPPIAPPSALPIPVVPPRPSRSPAAAPPVAPPPAAPIQAPAPGHPPLPTTAMYTPTMTKSRPPQPEPTTSTGQMRRVAIDALLAEFNAVDEPFGPADLAPRSTSSASDLLDLDEPLPGFEDDEPPATPAAAAPAPGAPAARPASDSPAPDLSPGDAEMLAGYMFEDERGQEFRLDPNRKTPVPPGLQDLLKSYLDEAS